MMYRHEDYVDAIRFVREGMVQLQPLMSRHFAFTDYLPLTSTSIRTRKPP